MEIKRTLEFWKRKFIGDQEEYTPMYSPMIANGLLIGALLLLVGSIIFLNLKSGGSTMANMGEPSQSESSQSEEVPESSENEETVIEEELPTITVPASCGLVTFSTCWSIIGNFFDAGLPVLGDYDNANNCGLNDYSVGDKVKLIYEGQRLSELNGATMEVTSLLKASDYMDSQWGDNIFEFKNNKEIEKIDYIRGMVGEPEIIFVCHNINSQENTLMALKKVV